MSSSVLYYSQAMQRIEKEQIDPAYLLYGSESFLMDEIAALIAEKFLGSIQKEINYFLRYAPETALEEVLTLTTGGGLFSERKLIVYRDYQEVRSPNIPAILACLKQPSPDICLIFVARTTNISTSKFQKLKGAMSFVNLLTLRQRELESFIVSEFKKHKKSIDVEALQTLIYLVGDQIHDLRNEIVQVATFHQHKEVIGREDVEAVVGTFVTQTIFELIRAIVDKNIESSIFVLHHLLEKGESPHSILALLLRHLQILLKIHGFHSSGEKNNRTIQQKLRIYPRHFEEYLKDLASWKQSQLKAALPIIFQCDRMLKTSQAPARIAMDQMVIRLAALRA